MAFRLALASGARPAPVVVQENGTLNLIGDVGDEFARGILQFRGLLQQIAYSPNSRIFQVDGSLKPATIARKLNRRYISGDLAATN